MDSLRVSASLRSRQAGRHAPRTALAYTLAMERHVLAGTKVTSATLQARTTPVILTGLTANWSAFDKWDPQSFLKHYGDERVAAISSGYATNQNLKMGQVVRDLTADDGSANLFIVFSDFPQSFPYVYDMGRAYVVGTPHDARCMVYGMAGTSLRRITRCRANSTASRPRTSLQLATSMRAHCRRRSTGCGAC